MTHPVVSEQVFFGQGDGGSTPIAYLSSIDVDFGTTVFSHAGGRQLM